MRAYRVAEVNAGRKPSRLVVAESIFEAVNRYARCHVIHLEGPLFDSHRENPCRFACVRGDHNEGRQFIAYAVGREF